MSNDKELKMRKSSFSEEGQAMVETLIVLIPVVFLILLIMQVALMYNAKLITNYAAFCAARAGCVYNADGKKMRRAAALALTSISPRITQDLGNVLEAAVNEFGLSDIREGLEKVNDVVRNIPDIPLIGEIERYISAYIRTNIEDVKIEDTHDGKKIITVKVKYYLKCAILPMGIFSGDRTEFRDYIRDLHGRYPSLAILRNIEGRVMNWNIPITSICKLRYWTPPPPKNEDEEIVYITEEIPGVYHTSVDCVQLHQRDNPERPLRAYEAVTLKEAKDKGYESRHRCRS